MSSLKLNKHCRCSPRRGSNTFLHSALTSLVILVSVLVPCAKAAQAELKDLSINGDIRDGKARLVIETQVQGLKDDKKLLYATELQHTIRVAREKAVHTIVATFDILQGEPR